MADPEKAMDVESRPNEAHEGDLPSDEDGGKVNRIHKMDSYVICSLMRIRLI